MIEVREASRADLGQIVSVHERCFPGFLMTMLGSTFLRVYYETSLEYSGTIFLKAQEEGCALVGFAVGYVSPSGFYALLRRRRWRLAMAAARAALLAPRLLPRVLGGISRMNRNANCGACSGLGVELASIGVLPAASGKGLGGVGNSTYPARASQRGGVRIPDDRRDEQRPR